MCVNRLFNIINGVNPPSFLLPVLCTFLVQVSVGLRAEKKENFKQSKVGARLSEITTKHAVALGTFVLHYFNIIYII